MTTVSWRCAICGRELPTLRDPMFPPLGRLRICRLCTRTVCRKDSVKVGDAFECVECRSAAKG